MLAVAFTVDMDLLRTDMKEDVLIDYATPLMNVERLAKEVHDACLHRTLAEAEERALELVTESRLLVQTLRHMQNK